MFISSVVSSSVSGSTLIANVASWANKVGLRRFDEAVPIEDLRYGFPSMFGNDSATIEFGIQKLVGRRA